MARLSMKYFNKINVSRKISKMPIKVKIIAAFIVVILFMGCLNAYLMISLSSYNRQYNTILTNIIYANHINEKAEQIPKVLSDIIFKNVKLEESGHRDMIKEVNNSIQAIGKELTEADSISKLNSVERLMESLSEENSKAEELIRQKKTVAALEHVQNAAKISGFIRNNIQEFILMELRHSDMVKQRIENKFKTSITMNIVVMCIVVAFSVVSALMISRNIADPIKDLCTKATLIASGNLTIDRLQVKTRDELRELADAFNGMVDNLKEIIRKVYDVSEKVHTASTQLSESAEQNSRGGEEISAAVQEMVAGIHTQNSESQNTMKAVENMYNISQDIATSSERILNNANQSVELASEGTQCINRFISQLKAINQVIHEASEVTEKLNLSSKEMNKILNTISSISSQTNLLSLNASIEAARAGEAGKGFAVVAQEIRKLAEESASSAKRIGDIIKSVQTESDLMNSKMQESLTQMLAGNQIAEQARKYFESIERENKVVNKDVQAISSELKHLVAGIENVNNSMIQIEKILNANVGVSESISATVEQQAASLEEVSASATVLSELAGELDIVVKKFKI
ncbi:MAG: methyl-accepting chemotaxis sensory transducer [Clostridia bacterium]|jgi:methyl-accepting chemotaxis protein|nr:methyl-accepting chemotaxis sensory transducer [Clostridia bacterium]